MKLIDPPPASNPPGPFIKRRSSDSAGWALVVVLSLVALISFLLIAILAGSRSELSMTAAYAQVQESRTLVDSTVNTVIAEIREASTTPDTAWISQPGLIRTFDASGNEATAYKLYSAAEMIVPAGFDPAANVATEVPADWLSRTTEFVDLNEPVTVDGDLVYPILDPAAEGIIEGFKNQVATTSVATSAENPMPMPVRWLYVLEDGTYRPKIGNTIAGASADNKPVARVAFWTDDESCKININTASSGDYWDTPRGRGNLFESGRFNSRALAGSRPIVDIGGLAASPPGNQEYQRFPGHPATTSLDLVLNTTANPFLAGGTDLERRKQIYEITPRIAFTGSELGTKFPLSSDPVATDDDRLYATVDELFYGPDRNGQLLPAAEQNLARAKFFLTANSRSPETTLFNTPRISIWPVDEDPANRTPFDRVIAFCATVDGEEYFVTREGFSDAALAGSVSNSDSTPRGSAPILASDAGQNALSPTADFSTDNLDLYNYAAGLMGRPVPGYGASLNTKLGADGPQLLTEIFDYIRITNLYDLSHQDSAPFTARPYYLDEGNIIGRQIPREGALLGNQPRPRDGGSQALERYNAAAYSGTVVPLEHPTNNTRGLGRAPVIAGLTLVFMANDPQDRTLKYETDANGAESVKTNAYTSKAPTFSSFADARASGPPQVSDAASMMTPFAIVSVATPATGGVPMTHHYEVEIEGLDALTAQVGSASADLGFSSPAQNWVYLSNPGQTLTGSGPFWTQAGFGPVIEGDVIDPKVKEFADSNVPKPGGGASFNDGASGANPKVFGLLGRGDPGPERSHFHGNRRCRRDRETESRGSRDPNCNDPHRGLSSTRSTVVQPRARRQAIRRFAATLGCRK